MLVFIFHLYPVICPSFIYIDNDKFKHSIMLQLEAKYDDILKV